MQQKMKFVGTELPKSRNNGGTKKHKAQTVTGRRAATLRLHPGEWARWPSKVTTSDVKKSLANHKGTFEVASVVINGERRTFARYVRQTVEA